MSQAKNIVSAHDFPKIHLINNQRTTIMSLTGQHSEEHNLQVQSQVNGRRKAYLRFASDGVMEINSNNNDATQRGTGNRHIKRIYPAKSISRSHNLQSSHSRFHTWFADSGTAGPSVPSGFSSPNHSELEILHTEKSALDYPSLLKRSETVTSNR